MKQTTLAAMLFIVAASASAQDREDSAWTKFGLTDKSEFSFRNGSFEISQTKGGKTVASLIVQSKYKPTDTIDYRKWYVSADDCLAGIGKVVFLKTDGTYLYENDYVSEGDSIASSGGDIICAVYKAALAEQSEKGI